MELSDYLRILRSHWIGVALIALLVVLAAGAYTLTQDKVYAADASGLVSTGGTSNPALNSVNDELAKSRAVSYVDIAQSRATAERVIRELDLDAEPASLVGQISVEQPVDTVSLRITARAGSPEEAQQLADAWVKALAAEVDAFEDPQGRDRPGTPSVVPVESAVLPSTPVSPQPVRNLGLALVVGLLLGFGYALLRHTLDRRLRTPGSVEQRFDTTVVAAVPEAPVLGHEQNARATVALVDDGPQQRHAAAAEAFRKLRTNLVFMDVDNPPRTIVVTSPRPGDGKSTVALNLAAAIAVGGQPVVLVDADLRRPTVADSLGLVEGVGLTDVLVGRISAEEALQGTAEHQNLQVLAAGRIPPNPSELLGSKAMRALLAELSSNAMVILDAPPLLPVTDAAVLAAGADGALIVISAGKTLDTELAATLGHLEAVKARALGVILNKVPRKGDSGYSGYYGEYHAKPAATEGKDGSRGKQRAAAG